MTSEILTPRLRLLPCEEAHLLALIKGNAAFTAYFGNPVLPGYMDFPEALKWSLEKIRAFPGDHWWQPRLFILRESGAVVGLGGYKGPPDENGAVEIGYSIAPQLWGQGLATEAARALTEAALKNSEISRVRAKTLAEMGPSPHVLEKCGFEKIAEEMDEDDGAIWLWEKTRSKVELF